MGLRFSHCVRYFYTYRVAPFLHHSVTKACFDLISASSYYHDAIINQPWLWIRAICCTRFLARDFHDDDTHMHHKKCLKKEYTTKTIQRDTSQRSPVGHFERSQSIAQDAHKKTSYGTECEDGSDPSNSTCTRSKTSRMRSHLTTILRFIVLRSNKKFLHDGKPGKRPYIPHKYTKIELDTSEKIIPIHY